MAVRGQTVGDLGAWLIFEDEAGQGLRPPKGRTGGRRGRTPVVNVTDKGTHRVSLAALLAVKQGERPHLFYRALTYRGRAGEPKGFTERDCIRLLDAAHAQLGGPIVLVWDNLGSHRSTKMRRHIDARNWLTVFYLPPYTPELNPLEGVWAHLKTSLANLAKHTIDQLTDLIRTRLKHIQHRPALITGILNRTHLQIPGNPHYRSSLGACFTGDRAITAWCG
nr:transposase [Actinomadura parmotrematis]